MRNTSHRVLFLARELSGYFLSCLEFALSENADLHIQIIYWPVNSEAPFELSMEKDRLHFIPVERMDDDAFSLFISNWQPSLWIVSGWADDRYMRWVKKFKHCPKIVAFDTQWRNSLIYQIGAKWLYVKSIRFFEGAWVPGQRQAILAQKFGFTPERIKKGYYVADENVFRNLHSIHSDGGLLKIIFVNRIVPEKGFPDAIIALGEHIIQNHLSWKITVVGTGPQLGACPALDCIDYLGFVQPQELPAILKQHHLYVLASSYEPWGVSVHEAANCGLPLILSSAVGAADAFLEDGVNGFSFVSGDFLSMIQAIERIHRLGQREYNDFSHRSHELSKQINHKMWSNQLIEWLKMTEKCVG